MKFRTQPYKQYIAEFDENFNAHILLTDIIFKAENLQDLQILFQQAVDKHMGQITPVVNEWDDKFIHASVSFDDMSAALTALLNGSDLFEEENDY